MCNAFNFSNGYIYMSALYNKFIYSTDPKKFNPDT